MSYVSPIKIFYAEEPEEGWTDKIGKYLAGEVDNLVLESCVKVGCHVDKDELEKALRYDRGQYEKGYEDGKREAAAAIEALQDEVKRLEPKRGEMAEVVRCKDCKHKPTGTGVHHDIEFPDAICPCQCYEDYWYSWMPSDDWYCGNGEKMEVQDGQ